MGIDYDGGMIVGHYPADDVSFDDEEFDSVNEWAEEHGMDMMADFFDADTSYCTVGFKVDDVPISEMEGEWLKDVKAKAAKFKELTGMEPTLYGTQDIW